MFIAAVCSYLVDIHLQYFKKFKAGLLFVFEARKQMSHDICEIRMRSTRLGRPRSPGERPRSPRELPRSSRERPWLPREQPRSPGERPRS